MFADDMILYIENPIDAIRKLLELIKELGEMAGYKINTQKSFAFPYTNNEKSETQIKETCGGKTEREILSFHACLTAVGKSLLAKHC